MRSLGWYGFSVLPSQLFGGSELQEACNALAGEVETPRATEIPSCTHTCGPSSFRGLSNLPLLLGWTKTVEILSGLKTRHYSSWALKPGELPPKVLHNIDMSRGSRAER